MEKLSTDLHIHICEFLHPSRILALRQTCKAYHQATSQRIVWIHALNRTCYQNSLFLPTFPISDMSVAELERAATTPRRWIALSSSKKKAKDGFLICKTRPLKGLHFHSLHLIPGGRYLVAYGLDYLTVWDMGYVSNSDAFWQPTKIWGTAVKGVQDFLVHPTPDGMGIRILTYSYSDVMYLFEIYPKQNIQHTRVNDLSFNFLDEERLHYFLYGNRIVVYARKKGIVIVWDFMANTVASWLINMPGTEGFYLNRIFRATETAIMVLHTRDPNHALWIFQIPPLVPKTPLFGTEQELPQLAPILTFKYSDTSAIAGFPIPNSWYNGDLSSPPLYFDVVGSPNKQTNVGRYILNIASDLSTLSLTPTAADRVPNPIRSYSIYSKETAYRICENSSVNVSHGHGAFIKLNAITLGCIPSSDSHDSSQIPATHINKTPLARMSQRQHYSFCPASARLVYENHLGDLVVCDFL